MNPLTIVLMAVFWALFLTRESSVHPMHRPSNHDHADFPNNQTPEAQIAVLHLSQPTQTQLHHRSSLASNRLKLLLHGCWSPWLTANDTCCEGMVHKATVAIDGRFNQMQ
ncbi:hypothetical protein SV7mr_38600 [Stieleria bergensis]|uniref:Uncharacterized protein n=1 Tax=Stieleria bergensis TaxID=2528025 RepID=A0A517SYU8_9BACT|nr:MAG: hypothetical protein CBB71_10580 [Rhodopirellula sp. TMED11]QDT61325.1 hypothetical protein SV7mr_38600 [Planctomycetes bacterium SV_7m_r]